MTDKLWTFVRNQLSRISEHTKQNFITFNQTPCLIILQHKYKRVSEVIMYQYKHMYMFNIFQRSFQINSDLMEWKVMQFYHLQRFTFIKSSGYLVDRTQYVTFLKSEQCQVNSIIRPQFSIRGLLASLTGLVAVFRRLLV